MALFPFPVCLVLVIFKGEKNEVILGFVDANQMMLNIRGQRSHMEAESSDVYDMRLLGWKQHCFTWRFNGEFKV